MFSLNNFRHYLYVAFCGFAKGIGMNSIGKESYLYYVLSLAFYGIWLAIMIPLFILMLGMFGVVVSVVGVGGYVSYLICVPPEIHRRIKAFPSGIAREAIGKVRPEIITHLNTVIADAISKDQGIRNPRAVKLLLRNDLSDMYCWYLNLALGRMGETVHVNEYETDEGKLVYMVLWGDKVYHPMDSSGIGIDSVHFVCEHELKRTLSHSEFAKVIVVKATEANLSLFTSAVDEKVNYSLCLDLVESEKSGIINITEF